MDFQLAIVLGPPPPPKPVIVLPPPPDSIEQAKIIVEAREYVKNYTKQLPNFICVEVVRRDVDPAGAGSSEAVPWRCHRSLIADALLVRGIEVREIASATRTQPHRFTPWGKITEGQVTYPAEHKD